MKIASILLFVDDYVTKLVCS